MYCHACGKEAIADNNFCTACGVVLHRNAESNQSKSNPDGAVEGTIWPKLFVSVKNTRVVKIIGKITQYLYPIHLILFVLFLYSPLYPTLQFPFWGVALLVSLIKPGLRKQTQNAEVQMPVRRVGSRLLCQLNRIKYVIIVPALFYTFCSDLSHKRIFWEDVNGEVFGNAQDDMTVKLFSEMIDLWRPLKDIQGMQSDEKKLKILKASEPSIKGLLAKLSEIRPSLTDALIFNCMLGQTQSFLQYNNALTDFLTNRSNESKRNLQLFENQLNSYQANYNEKIGRMTGGCFGAFHISNEIEDLNVFSFVLKPLFYVASDSHSYILFSDNNWFWRIFRAAFEANFKAQLNPNFTEIHLPGGLGTIRPGVNLSEFADPIKGEILAHQKSIQSYQTQDLDIALLSGTGFGQWYIRNNRVEIIVIPVDSRSDFTRGFTLPNGEALKSYLNKPMDLVSKYGIVIEDGYQPYAMHSLSTDDDTSDTTIFSGRTITIKETPVDGGKIRFSLLLSDKSSSRGLKRTTGDKIIGKYPLMGESQTCAVSTKDDLYCLWGIELMYVKSGEEPPQPNVGKSGPIDFSPFSPIATKAKAEKGDPISQYEMGIFYAGEAYSNKADLDLAKSWYEKAAEQGLVMAQLSLGNSYLESDPVKAYTWLETARRNVKQDFYTVVIDKHLADLRMKLSPEILNEANLKIDKWINEHHFLLLPNESKQRFINKIIEHHLTSDSASIPLSQPIPAASHNFQPKIAQSSAALQRRGSKSDDECRPKTSFEAPNPFCR